MAQEIETGFGYLFNFNQYFDDKYKENDSIAKNLEIPNKGSDKYHQKMKLNTPKKSKLRNSFELQMRSPAGSSISSVCADDEERDIIDLEVDELQELELLKSLQDAWSSGNKEATVRYENKLMSKAKYSQ